MRQADPLEGPRRPRGAGWPGTPRYSRPVATLSSAREVLEQEELLEDHAEAVRAQAGQPAVGQALDRVAGDAHRAGGRPVQAGGEIEQRGLAGAGRADDGDQLAAADGQVDRRAPTRPAGVPG